MGVCAPLLTDASICAILNPMKTLLLTLGLSLSISPVWAQDAPKLSPELELGRQILALKVQLKDERDKMANLTIAYGQCAATIGKSEKIEPWFAEFQGQVEAANPTFTYDVATGVFTPKKKP